MDQLWELVNSLTSEVVSALLVIVAMWLPKRIRRWRLKKKIEQAYFKLRLVCEPGTLNPKKPGNMEFMKSDARDFVNPLKRSLAKAGFYSPPHLHDRTRFTASVVPLFSERQK